MRITQGGTSEPSVLNVGPQHGGGRGPALSPKPFMAAGEVTQLERFETYGK